MQLKSECCWKLLSFQGKLLQYTVQLIPKDPAKPKEIMNWQIKQLYESVQAEHRNNHKAMDEMQRVNLFSSPRQPGDLRSSTWDGGTQAGTQGLLSSVHAKGSPTLLFLLVYPGFGQV